MEFVELPPRSNAKEIPLLWLEMKEQLAMNQGKWLIIDASQSRAKAGNVARSFCEWAGPNYSYATRTNKEHQVTTAYVRFGDAA
jgi:hypothetical protein